MEIAEKSAAYVMRCFMFVCLCRGVTEKQIQKAVSDGACTMRDLNCELGVASQCGKCGRHARELLKQSNSDETRQSDNP